MYRIRFEGGVSSDEQAAIAEWVPKTLDTVIGQGVGVGDHLLTRWFGASATGAGTNASDCLAKRQKMSDYVLRQCQVITFVKKLYGKKVDKAEVVEGDLAQVMRSCFGNDPDGFVPSGVRIYVLGNGLIEQDAHERFNTITHELSHRVIDTTDWVYGKQESLDLATTKPAKAADCAENWGYFYQELLESL